VWCLCLCLCLSLPCLPCPAFQEAFAFACLRSWLPLPPPCAVALPRPPDSETDATHPIRAVRRLPPTEVSSLPSQREQAAPSPLSIPSTPLQSPPVCDSRPFCLPAGPSIRHRHHAAAEVLLRPPTPGMLSPLFSALLFCLLTSPTEAGSLQIRKPTMERPQPNGHGARVSRRDPQIHPPHSPRPRHHAARRVHRRRPQQQTLT
jgi:hypothetical protein